jgi:glycosyltransferase involved in cell wall biosynthesis
MMNYMNIQNSSFDKSIRVLIVSTEYPPMRGGVGRYTENLTKSLVKLGVEVDVLCNEKGKGNYHGLSPTNQNNSNLIMKVAHDSGADIVHVQYEHGLYGLKLNSLNPNRISTNIDSVYHDCKIPIVTTMHSGYTFKQWMSLARIVQNTCKIGKYTTLVENYWRRLLNYHSFRNLDRDKVALSKATIVLSHYMQSIIAQYGNYHGDDRSIFIIYHGSQPSSKLASQPTKEQARLRFNLPNNKRIAVAIGFRTVTKGWDIIKNMHVPENWLIVTNSSRNDYSRDNINLQLKKDGVIDLHKDFLEEEDLSILMYAADVTILPYTVSSSSGVMFDGFSHGLPFLASDIDLFKEFSSQGLGITVKRKPDAFVDGLLTLAKDYDHYQKYVYKFKEQLNWDLIARQHIGIYRHVLSNPMALVVRSSNSNPTSADVAA